MVFDNNIPTPNPNMLKSMSEFVPTTHFSSYWSGVSDIFVSQLVVLILPKTSSTAGLVSCL